MRFNATVTPKSGHQLWGIYYTDREYAGEHGDPLRTVIEAPTKLAAEDEAARLGFRDAWAHPVTAEEANTAKWLPTSGHKRQTNLKRTRAVIV